MILVNLSILSKKPTGISIYARNILPSLSQLNSKFLVCNFDNRFTTFNSYLIPKELSPDFGLKDILNGYIGLSLLCQKFIKN